MEVALASSGVSLPPAGFPCPPPPPRAPRGLGLARDTYKAEKRSILTAAPADPLLPERSRDAGPSRAALLKLAQKPPRGSGKMQKLIPQIPGEPAVLPTGGGPSAGPDDTLGHRALVTSPL
ncbi:hypothetical protein VULLAG_LOCUS15966 [Vulpes lagopus]